MEIQIFAEGNDIKFLKDYISFLDLPVSRLLNDKTDGWTKLRFVKGKFEEATNKGVKNLVVFDANGNFAQRSLDINTEKVNLQINFELFLFPNNITTGMVETLLIDIIPESKKPLLACFDDYCLNIHKINPDIKFSLKSKFFAYLEATEQPLNMEKINFKNEQFWDLNHPAMNNLKSFLFNNITI